MKKYKILNSLLTIILISTLFYGCYLYKDNLTSLANNILFLKDKSNDYIAQISGYLINKNELNNLKDSEISYENKIFDSSYYPYFNMLNDNEKNLYNQLIANIENYTTSFKTNIKISIDETKKAIEAVYNDHPEFFWLDSSFSYKYTEDKTVVQIILSYNDLIKNIDYNLNIFQKEANNIINTANKFTNDYEKEKYVHDILIDNIIYDLSADNNQSAYSALINRRTVCAGYARAFQYIMTKLNIPTFYVTGYAKNEDHAWNIILLDNEYYNIDLTWDDSNSNYNFFNITDLKFFKTHTRNSLSINLPTCNGTKYTYKNISQYSTLNTNKKRQENKENIETNTYSHDKQIDNNNQTTIPPDNSNNKEEENNLNKENDLAKDEESLNQNFDN